MSVKRWVFEEVGTTNSWVVPYNPSEMSAPTTPRQMSYAFGSLWGTDRIRGKDSAPSSPVEWTFGGLLRSKDHYDQLLLWAKKLTVVRITDHLDRTFEVVITNFAPIERLPTPTTDWRADYTITCLLLKEVTA